MLTRVAVKLSKNKYPENELEIMKKCDNQFVIKLLDSFSVDVTLVGTFYGIVMDYYEVRIIVYILIPFENFLLFKTQKERGFSESNCREEKILA